MAVSTTGIDLLWTDSFSSETGYVIQRSPDGVAWASVAVAAAGSSAYGDSGLFPGTIYYYRIAATNEVGLSVWSATDNATTVAGTFVPVSAPAKKDSAKED